MDANKRVIITGASGMVGEGVLLECLADDRIGQVLVVGRRHCGHKHPKLEELLIGDFFNLAPVKEKLIGYDACFFCLGVTSVGKNEESYGRLTYDLTMNFARALAETNSSLIFCYVSGSGTDSSGKGRLMWARVKGRTESELMDLAFRSAYMFRPAFIEPTRGARNTLGFYKVLGWSFPVLRKLFPKYICSLKDLGRAMINTMDHEPGKRILEVPDIIRLAHAE